MPLFQIEGQKLQSAELVNFRNEKELQFLVEKNLGTVFNCRFIATEYPTGPVHSGRIDTLALSEDNNTVIIEYKKVESSDLVNQSLFYLSWLDDHRGDFEVAATKQLGNESEVDWSEIRVICIAPGYKKYDLHAVKMMGANIELWQYKLFNGKTLYFEQVFGRYAFDSTSSLDQKKIVQIEAGKKAAITRSTGQYTFNQHMDGVSETIKVLTLNLRDRILAISEHIEEVPKKHYIAYKVSQNFVCLGIKQNELVLYLKLNPKKITIAKNMRDVTDISHYPGKLELRVQSEDDIEQAVGLVQQAYESLGG